MDAPATPAISDELRRFIDEAPAARAPHITFLQTAAASLSRGATVLDVGAGDAPYRELFAHTTYLTCDWENSIYEPDRPPTSSRAPTTSPSRTRASMRSCARGSSSTSPNRAAVLDEFHRLIRPAGRLWVTTPFTWYLHEQPYDYYRYTSHGLRYLLDRAGFADIEIKPMNDSFSTLAQLVSHLGYMMGRQTDGYDDQREIISTTMTRLSTLIGSFSNFDLQWILPISFSASATRPAR